MRVYEKCSNLKRQKTNLQHKQTTPLAYPPWVKSKFEANSHYSPPSFSVKQKERSSLSVHYNRWICIGRGLYLLPFDWLYYDMQSSVPEPRKKILWHAVISTSSFLCCTCKEHHACHGRALPHISKNPGAIWQIHPRSHSHHPRSTVPFHSCNQTYAWQTESSIQHSPWH